MALSDPQSLAEALPDPKDVAAARKKLEDADVKYVLSCWIDLFGLPKTKPVPISDFELLCAGKGPQFAVHSVSFVPELGPADSDHIMLPDLNTLTICPWDTSMAWMIADLWWEDKPYNQCPRSALKRAIRESAARGYEYYAGFEPEFIAMKWEDGNPVKAFDDDPSPGKGLRPRRQAFGYDVEYTMDSMGFLGELIDVLENLGWNLHDVVAEGAYSQFELDFHYTDVLEICDRFVFLRIMLKEIAKKHGIFVTFMPKPTTGDWRSGAHMNISVRSTDKPDENLFEGEEGQWAKPVYHAIAGLLRHGGALTAVTCSTVNSYNGLVPRVGGFEGGTVTWAPTHMTYGSNNRSAMLRLPQSRFCVENRAADMCMNPYLSFAISIAAMTEGMTNQLEPDEPLNRDLYSMSEEEIASSGAKRLPRNLLEAIEILSGDEFVKEVMGRSMHNSYLKYKLDEWERYHQEVTDWEVREYLRLY
ncbi:glutamine synthetase family protein [Pseudomonadota bacterium]